MKEYILIIFPILISFGISAIPEWNLNTSAKDLLSSSEYYEYIVCHRVYYRLELKMVKKIKKEKGKIYSLNEVTIGGITKEVPFDNIESYYYIFGKYIICPFGEYHPYDFTESKYIQPDTFQKLA